MPTLNQIATQVAFDLNRPFDQILINRLADLITQEAAKYLRQSIEKNGIDQALIQTYIDDLVIKDVSVDTSVIDVGQNVLRTANKIYTPLRIKGDSPFTFIGSADFKVTIRYSPSYARQFDSYLPNIGNTPSYDYINGYLYLFGVSKMRYLAIQSVFENPLEILKAIQSGDTSDTEGFCVSDHALPIPMDIINDIKKEILKGELRVTDSKDKEEATHLDTN